ncbi:hypothetical protein [Qipengyuania nanhaisediminis]|uniref:hypothetical protein n=1 Tax=Qipengyuania nanhaisediminis TaxID=604088 RepID=UPI0038B3D5B7
MNELELRFLQDKRMRDAAKQVLHADIEHLRASLSGGNIARKVFGTVGEGAKDVLEIAREQAEDKTGVLAALVGALIVWLAREPIFAFLGLGGDHEDQPPLSQSQEETGPASPESEAGEGDPQ